MKSACGICGRMEEDSLLIEQPCGWPAVCKECAAKLGPTISSFTPVQAAVQSRIVPPFTLVQAAGNVAFWVKLIAFINILGGILLVCGGFAAMRENPRGLIVGASGAAWLVLGIALWSATRWFMLFNMTLQDIGQRVRLNLPKEAKGADGGEGSPQELSHP